jgi:membrane protein implicated in regulation of membrane protease activity
MWWLLWWVWLAVAIVLGVLEVLAPVFVFLGFSAGAFGTAVLVLLGVDFGIGGTLLVFAVLSAAAYWALRLWLGTHKGRAKIIERDINEN